MSAKVPSKEVQINVQVVRSLLREQYPELAHLPITYLAAGWDNENYRLGDEYLVRLPRRKQAVALIEHEIQYLSLLQHQLPILVPAPRKIGLPTSYYPWKWTINPWFAGTTADRGAVKDSEAHTLVQFLTVLHQYNPTHAPFNPYRSVPLQEKAENINTRMLRLQEKSTLINKEMQAAWRRALSAPVPEPKCLIHGDLHPSNIIVEEEKVKAIIDWGDLCLGDPATDLASLWMIFPDKQVRDAALQAYGASTALVQRAIGWAIFFGTILLDTGWGANERQAQLGRQILCNLQTEWG